MTRRAGLDRAQVVATAAVLADQHGLDSLTLAQVAAQLGVRLPSLYNHVDGLPGLRHELAVLGLRDILDGMRRAAVGKSGDAAVLALALAYRGYVLEHPGRYAATVRAPAPDDDAIIALGEEIIDTLVAVLSAYDLDETATIHAIRGLRAVVHGFATLELGGGFDMPVDREASFHVLVELYCAGLRSLK